MAVEDQARRPAVNAPAPATRSIAGPAAAAAAPTPPAAPLPSAAAAPAGAPSFQDILLVIGQLNYTWTNTESLLIHLIAGLARVDKETAIIIFLTLNTTRARIELVERLSKMRTTAPACRRDVLAVTQALTRQAKLRNKYSHCVYSFDPDGTRGSTQLMRIFESRETLRYGKTEALDEAELSAIRTCIATIGQINRTMLGIIRTYGFPT